MKKDYAQRTCFYLNKELVKKLKLYCIENELSMSDVIEHLIKELLSK